jgi:acetyltransferase-like isoleucine patch superfamily enzyme
MRKIFYFTWFIFEKFNSFFSRIISLLVTKFLFYINNVKSEGISTKGIPYLRIKFGGVLIIGERFKMNNGMQGNVIGRPQRCVFIVGRGAQIKIGNNVGISQSAIICRKKIEIGDNVKIGGGVCIYDTDFHSLKSTDRLFSNLDKENTVNKSIKIEENVFIGAHSTILKGVTIGKNSIIGAGSVISKSIPANEIWAGNPVKFIKST